MNSEETVYYSFNKKRTILWILFIVFFLLAFYFVFSFNTYRITKINPEKYVLADNSNYVFEIEKIRYDNKKTEIKGYFFYKMEEMKTVSMHLVLNKKETNTFYKIPTYIEYREDIKKIANNGNDYYWSGFVSVIKNGSFDFNSEYEMYILCTINGNTSLVKVG